MGVIVALLQVNEGVERFFATRLDLGPALVRVLGPGGYELLGVAFFAALAAILYRAGRRSHVDVE
jgi:hypothetical protein